MKIDVISSSPTGVDGSCELAFTLIEVLVASAVLAMALMGVLTLCSSGLKTARSLQQTHVDAGTLAAWFSMTNRLEEGDLSGDFREMLGDAAPDATWNRRISEVNSNGLFQVDFLVNYHVDRKPLQSQMTIFLYRPESVRRLGAR